MGETLALELVPWTCAVDDSKDTLTDKSGSILTCMPAYLQLTRTPGAQSACAICLTKDNQAISEMTLHMHVWVVSRGRCS